MKRLKVGLISLLAVLVVVMTGCQAVGGVNLNEVFVKNLDVKTYEAYSDLQLELIVSDESALSEEEKQMVEWLDGLKIAFTDMKVESYTTMSMEGYVAFGEESLDFAMSIKNNETAIWIEGAKEPFVFPAQMTIDPTMPHGIAQLQETFSSESFTEDMVETVKVLYSFIVNNFPNPPTVTVDQVTETVNGEELELTLVHMELNGEQIVPLVKQFLENVLKDEEGTKQMLGELHRILAPIFLEILEATADEDELEQLEQIRPYLENETLAVEFVYTLLKPQLESVVEDYDGLVEGLLQSEAATQVFHKDNVLSMDLYIDSDGIMRKQDFEMTLLALEMEGIDGLIIRSTNELWNVNGDVKANLLDTTNAVFIDENVTEEQIRNNIDESSKLFQWIDSIGSLLIPSGGLSVALDLSGNDSIPGYEQQPYINDQGYTMVPARYVSEELLADVDWDSTTKTVTITDFLTGNVIVIEVDATTATINGEEVSLDSPAKLHDGRLFVPLRFIVEALAGELEWDHESKIVTIHRVFPF